MNHKKRVLVGSPVRQKPEILKEFLQSLKELEQKTIELSFLLIDDNDNVQSSQLLNQFANSCSNVMLHKHTSFDTYNRNEITHSWNEQLVWKVADLKNMIIQIALEFNYDYLFFIDSDIVLHPFTLEQLKKAEKEIISEVFWTKWQPDFPELPQVWLEDHYTMYYKHRNEQLTPEEALYRQERFVQKLRVPGVYEVGGLGACTLINRTALEKGANFKEIKNVSFWGEDRHFCIRAAALGIELHVDTHLPAYHIYRDSDLAGVAKFKSSYNKSEEQKVEKFVEEAITALGTFHYKLGYSVDWKPLFSDEIRDLLVGQLKEQQEQNSINRVKVKAYVENLSYVSNDQQTKTHQVTFTLHNYILQQGEREENHYSCTCEVLENDNAYSILSFSIVSVLNNNVIFPHHRKPPKLTLSMVVKNESTRFLKRVLESHLGYIDNAVIIDDGSSDHSAKVCKDILIGIPHKIVSNKTSKFSNEVELREQQWKETIEEAPDWIINVDADEIFEDKFQFEIHELAEIEQYSTMCFPLFDMWDEEHYREDEYWFAHKTHRPFIARYSPKTEYEWLDEKQHCGRFPKNILEVGPNLLSSLKLKHLGWSREEDRLEKYRRYQLLDVDKTEFRANHYESILDKTPNLVLWKD
ncbi:glycosyl transferase [Paenibacillus sp. YPG26]|uniref:glycosyltransferase family 2 protein n=1 Tax=Paenibacillus sp. YPG26 TaxID=2878915 RepID=UPI00203A4555|nr:glycosyl transferase [Paenibacillus sp. YPG26]USB32836.1 glycosyl transferase [Paenibacillus sp. YPG26]